KLQKTDFYRSEYQKRKDKICPFSSLVFFQPTTVDKEPKKLDIMRFLVGRFTPFSSGIEILPISFYYI
ncbi:hypothetical protein OLF52_03940, partial [Streptococcus pneumoniae]|nr:hypothetical protein [Streptococcus pneumoniae]MDG9060477.1 hypothetical protein [Streptococcus pneumoniae]MDG9394082.1 hypothetical protein [Streptococcus pneumoniae]MDG9426072.1 hypothetical protein [Streptococcus pneumoniae]